MKRKFNYCMLLCLIFASGGSIAQSITKATPKPRILTSITESVPSATDSPVKPAKPNDTITPAPTLAVPAAPTPNADAVANKPAISYPEPVTAIFQIELNGKKNMLNVKTDGPGKIYFISKKGKEKRECMVGGGLSYIFVENMLAPGKYTCVFSGMNGSTASVKLVYKPDVGELLTKWQHKLFPENKTDDARYNRRNK